MTKGLYGVGSDGTLYNENGKKLVKLPLRVASFIQNVQHKLFGLMK